MGNGNQRWTKYNTLTYCGLCAYLFWIEPVCIILHMFPLHINYSYISRLENKFPNAWWKESITVFVISLKIWKTSNPLPTSPVNFTNTTSQHQHPLIITPSSTPPSNTPSPASTLIVPSTQKMLHDNYQWGPTAYLQWSCPYIWCFICTF